MGVTNRGKYNILRWALRGVANPTTFYVALVTDAIAPNADINTLSELTEIAAGNGYTSGGIAVNNDATDFDTATEDDANDRALLQIKNLVWTAAGGALPGSGDGARYAVLTDDNATVGSREVYAWWDLLTGITVSDTQTLTLADLEIRATD
jgi:hypothetical protein